MTAFCGTRSIIIFFLYEVLSYFIFFLFYLFQFVDPLYENGSVLATLASALGSSTQNSEVDTQLVIRPPSTKDITCGY